MAGTAAATRVGLFQSHPSALLNSTHLYWDPLVLCPRRSRRNQRFILSSCSSARSSDSGRIPEPEPAAISAQETRIEQLWQEFFSNPSQWWDNRFRKKNPNYPDFKHRITKEALWIDNKFSPPWVQTRLAAMVQGQAVRTEQLWQEFFSDPSQWWDNRFDKGGS